MAFIPTLLNVRAAMQGKVNNNDAVFTLWFGGIAPADLAALQDLGDDLIGWMTTDVLPLLSNGYSLESVYLTAQDSDFAPFLTRTTGLPAAGAVNSPIIEPQTAPVIKFTTASRGRSGRGRNYLPGCPLSALASPGVVGATFRNAVLTAYQNLGPAVSAHNYIHTVVSHFHNHSARVLGVPQAVTGYSMVSDSVGTQRKRRIGIGS